MTTKSIYVPTNKCFCWYCATHIFALRDLQTGKIFVFLYDLIKKSSVTSGNCFYYTLLNYFGVRVYINVFHYIIFPYHLIATCTLTFGYIIVSQILPLLAVSLIFCLVSISGKKWSKNTTTNKEWISNRQFLISKITHGVMYVS